MFSYLSSKWGIFLSIFLNLVYLSSLFYFKNYFFSFVFNSSFFSHAQVLDLLLFSHDLILWQRVWDSSSYLYAFVILFLHCLPCDSRLCDHITKPCLLTQLPWSGGSLYGEQKGRGLHDLIYRSILSRHEEVHLSHVFLTFLHKIQFAVNKSLHLRTEKLVLGIKHY